MEISIPTYIKVIKSDAGKKTAYRAELLFHSTFASENAVLQRAITKLTRLTRKSLSAISQEWDHKELVEMAYNPAGLKQRTAQFAFELKSRHWRCKYFLATFPAFGRHIAFCPEIPAVWFEFDDAKSSQLDQRAAEVYRNYFRERLKQNPDHAHTIVPTAYNADSKRWLTWVDVHLHVDQPSAKENAKKMLALWDNQSVNGERELDRVGRNLDWQYPDDLDRCYGRAAEVEQLQRLLAMPDRRPVMLVGDSLTGKTALIHEVVARRVADRQRSASTTSQSVDKSKHNLWLLSPQRLISGMSHVGQWEERIHAILKTASKKDLTLYFDDPIGLLRAGKSSCSNLCVADVLRKSLQDRQVRVLGEMTNQGYQQLLNLDRGFADLFHVMRIESLDERKTVDVGIQVSRTIEQQQKTEFQPDVLPTVIRLQRQYVSHANFPGKAIRFLKQLAVKYPATTVDRKIVIEEMAESCGIQLPLIDGSQTLTPQTVSHRFQQSIVGQQAAVEACVDLVMAQKARLLPPGKPSLTMLFTGPTGVGKTETAKALAEYLFGDAKKLIRFDLNEFKTPLSAARLVGTLEDPEGLLTTAVRHRPYCVILLDEIEKGHPDVFDILLQVLGEGRLTDALGRTTDFTNAIIVMTSNLGARQSGSTVGFVPTEDQQQYITAAEKFFRPEFFNRIDRIVPFHSLNRQQIGQIAQRLMQGVVTREGLMRRQCILNVGPQLISDIVDIGYDQSMGARGLKRAIENHFTFPVAAELSNISSDTPTLIKVRKSGQGLDVDVCPLKNADQANQPNMLPPEKLAAAAKEFLTRFQSEFLHQRPAGEITGSGTSPQLLHYFSMTEAANTIQETIFELENQSQSIRTASPPALPISQGRRISGRTLKPNESFGKTFARDSSVVADITNFVNDAVGNRNSESDLLDVRLVNQCREIQAQAEFPDDEVILFFSPNDPHAFSPEGEEGSTRKKAKTDEQSVQRYEPYTFAFNDQLIQMGFETNLVDMKLAGRYVRFIHVGGTAALAMLKDERGYVLSQQSNGQIDLIELGCLSKTHSQYDSIRSTIESASSCQQTKRSNQPPYETLLKLDLNDLHDDQPLTVLRVTDGNEKIEHDYSSGLRNISFSDNRMWNQMLQHRMPVPPELVFHDQRGPR